MILERMLLVSQIIPPVVVVLTLWVQINRGCATLSEDRSALRRGLLMTHQDRPMIHQDRPMIHPGHLMIRQDPSNLRQDPSNLHQDPSSLLQDRPMILQGHLIDHELETGV